MANQLWRHIKRGTTYEVLTHDASLQCSTAPDFENEFATERWTIYRSVVGQVHYVRLTSEFLERFELVGEQA